MRTGVRREAYPRSLRPGRLQCGHTFGKRRKKTAPSRVPLNVLRYRLYVAWAATSPLLVGLLFAMTFSIHAPLPVDVALLAPFAGVSLYFWASRGSACTGDYGSLIVSEVLAFWPGLYAIGTGAPDWALRFEVVVWVSAVLGLVHVGMAFALKTARNPAFMERWVAFGFALGPPMLASIGWSTILIFARVTFAR